MAEVDISPLAKRLAEENNVDWRTLRGSGENGKVVERDVLDYLARVMAGDEDVNPTPEPLPQGMKSWSEQGKDQAPGEWNQGAAAAPGGGGGDWADDDLIDVDSEEDPEWDASSGPGVQKAGSGAGDSWGGDWGDDWGGSRQENRSSESRSDGLNGDEESFGGEEAGRQQRADPEPQIDEDIFLFDDEPAESAGQAAGAGFEETGPGFDQERQDREQFQQEREQEEVFGRAGDEGLGFGQDSGDEALDLGFGSADEGRGFGQSNDDEGRAFEQGEGDDEGPYDFAGESSDYQVDAEEPWSSPASDQESWSSPPSEEEPWSAPPQEEEPWSAPASEERPWSAPEPAEEPWSSPPQDEAPPAPDALQAAETPTPWDQPAYEQPPVTDDSGIGAGTSHRSAEQPQEPDSPAFDALHGVTLEEEQRAVSDQGVQGAVPHASTSKAQEDVAGAASAPAIPLRSSSPGIVLRRDAELGALVEAIRAVAGELGTEDGILTASFLLRAAAKAGRPWPLPGPDATLGLASLGDEGIDVALVERAANLPFRELVDECSRRRPATNAQPSLVVADLSGLGIDEAVLDLGRPVLTLGRILQRPNSAGYHGSLTLSGPISPDAGSRFLARVVELLAAPVRLVL